MQNSSSPNSTMLSIGNVVSLSISMYKSHFKQNLKVAVNAAIWVGLSKASFLLLLLVVVAQVGVFLFSKFTEVNSYFEPLIQGFVNPFFTAIVLIVCILFLIIGSAIFKLRQAQIARLTYSFLLNQPESLQQVLVALNSKIWHFWWLGVKVGFINMGVNTLLNRVEIGITEKLSTSPSLDGIEIVLTVIQCAISIWVSAVLSLAYVVFSVEGKQAHSTISRCWNLAKGFAPKITIIGLLAAIVTMPPYLAAFSLPVAAFTSLLHHGTPSRFYIFLASIGLFLAISWLLDLLLIPFTPIVNAVTYYDLRQRKEGVDLRLSTGDETSPNLQL